MLLAVMSNSAMAGWVNLGMSSSRSDKTFTNYADPATIRKTGNNVKMWDLLDFVSVQNEGANKPYMSLKAQSEYDCKKERHRLLFTALHSNNMGTGRVVSTFNGLGKWEPVASGSAVEVLWKFACRK